MMLDPALANALRRRPEGRAIMTQRWLNLCFIHFSVDPAEVEKLLPPGLTVDTFQGRAWIGYVPFEIRDLTFRPGGRVPTAHTFLETNVRTYVHQEGQNPGVWFFSLDAASRLACKGARVSFKLPYWHASMTYQDADGVLNYGGKRDAPPHPGYKLSASPGPKLPQPAPGTLKFFLVERYLLYSYFGGRLHTGRVHHTPYPLQSLDIHELEDNLVPAAGFQWGKIQSALFSPGVQVEIFRLNGQ